MLVLYGGPGLSDYTEGLVPLLGSACSLVRYTQRGVKPSVADGPFTVDQHVEDAARVLDAMDAGRVWVLGHSWGGYLAMQLALAQRHRLAGLVLVSTLGGVGDGGAAEIGPALFARTPPEVAEQVEQVEQRAERGEASDHEVIEAHTLLWPAYFADPALASELPPIEMSTRCFAETSESIESQQATGALERALPGLAMPVVLVHGRQDPIPISAAAATAALIPGARLEPIDDCGHFPWLEQPGVFARLVAEFVMSCSRG